MASHSLHAMHLVRCNMVKDTDTDAETATHTDMNAATLTNKHTPLFSAGVPPQRMLATETS